MNERIKELAEQAKLNPVLLLQHWGTNDALTDSEQESLERIEKFAELIVQECITIVENLDPGYEDYRNQVSKTFGGDCIEEMKFHFGIEEV
jgi:hypothetical protein